MKGMPHPRYDFLMAYSEELDHHGLLRKPDDPWEEETHDDLVNGFVACLPAPPKDPSETTPSEERDLAAGYVDWLAERGEMVEHPTLSASAVLERFLGRMQQR